MARGKRKKSVKLENKKGRKTERWDWKTKYEGKMGNERKEQSEM